MFTHPSIPSDLSQLAIQIKCWAKDIGFADLRISSATLPPEAEKALLAWLANGYHGTMDYMIRHGTLRVKPSLLVPGTLSVLSVRLNYQTESQTPQTILQDGRYAYIARYALGRDYHKVMRKRLQLLADKIKEKVGDLGYRVFSDSAPVAEVALAAQAGLGWRGKHTLLLNQQAGSFFFLGELFTTLPLPADPPVSGHCGSCTRCITHCPTKAIVAPYTVDARRCISYLTIESKEAIPLALRPLIGNRIYGCDDCQLVCPWNRFAPLSTEPDWAVRHTLDSSTLVMLFSWSEEMFKNRMAGSPIYRIGYIKWLSNLAVGLGNAPYSEEIVAVLRTKLNFPDQRVAEPVRWALDRHLG